MFRIISKITIDKYVLNFCTEISIKSNYENLTDTAKVVIPRKLSWENKPLTNGDGKETLLKVGMQVKIEAGYDNELETIFEGFLARIGTGTPVELECEDAMWRLKQITIDKRSYKSVTLQQLLADIMPQDFPFSCPAIVLGQFRISKATIAMILDELKKTYSIYSWVRDGKLFVGSTLSRTDENERKTGVYHFQKNIISSDLKFQNKEDVKIKIKAISILPTNQKIEIEEGDPSGESGQRTMHFYNLNETALRETAKREVEKLRFTGFVGKYKTFGFPMIRHGDYAVLKDRILPDRNGKYLIKSVERTLSVNDGYRQQIELDKKIG